MPVYFKSCVMPKVINIKTHKWETRLDKVLQSKSPVGTHCVDCGLSLWRTWDFHLMGTNRSALRSTYMARDNPSTLLKCPQCPGATGWKEREEREAQEEKARWEQLVEKARNA